MGTPPVNSYDEWTSLQETIVATPYHLDYHADESFQLFFYDNIGDVSTCSPTNLTHQVARAPRSSVFGALPSDRLKEECLEDLGGLIEASSRRG